MERKQSKKNALENGKPTKRRGRPKSKGLGDDVEKVLEATGIKKLVKFIAGEDCGCDERKDLLNKIFPYKQPKCLTEQEYTRLKDWDRLGNALKPMDQIFLARTHARVFNHKYYLPTCKCPEAFQTFETYFNELKEVAKTYNDDLEAVSK